MGISTKFKSFLGRSKLAVTTAVTAVAITTTMATATLAAETADTTVVTSITSSFTDLKATSLAILSAVAGIAIVLFAGIYGWRYGKKVFSIISK